MDVWKNEREKLTIKRNALFARYSRKPSDLQLATEIKTIDDAIAAFTEKITQETFSQYKSKSKSLTGTSES